MIHDQPETIVIGDRPLLTFTSEIGSFTVPATRKHEVDLDLPILALGGD